MKTELVQLSDIETAAGTQIRAKLDADAVDEYVHGQRFA